MRGAEHDGVLHFAGVPYAAPPTGTRRFRPPQPLDPWPGVRDALRPPPSAPQFPSAIDQVLGWGRRETSEDCLYLNVWTPALDDRARPVMVWIHGGAFQSGSGSIPWYSGHHLAARGDVVVVTINYRLGAFGFLHLAEMLGSEYASAGNSGLLDQVAALQWVRDNIAGFGGDPDRVTIFGQSAGAMSVGTLLGTPAAAGLFRHAIAQSGAAHNTSPAALADRVARQVLTELGVSRFGAEAVLSASTEQLLAAQQAIGAAGLPALDIPETVTLMLPFQPVIDGVVLDEPPLDVIAHDTASTATVITGTTADEWRLFDLSVRQDPLDETGLVDRCERIFAPVLGEGAGRHAVDVYRKRQPDAPPVTIWTTVMSDRVFRIPAIRLAEARLRAGAKATYLYEFTWPAAILRGILGACHGVEIPFVFDNLTGPGTELFLGPANAQLRLVAGATSGAWLAVARTGQPNHEGLPAWPMYDLEGRRTMELGATGRVVDDPAGAERELWDALL